ncbi:MAG: nitrogenase component 1 [Elusimicrobiota bacterium]|jgi:nitrogenase molybdenum-iron protein alpha/beta subunit
MPLRQDTAEDFALKVHNYGLMTGVSVALHAIPDAFLVLHTGVGCKYKGANQLMLHDRARLAMHREGYTEISDAVFVKGSAARVGPYLRNWHGKRRPAYMALVTSTFIEMAGEDIAGEVAKAAACLPCPVDYIRTLGFEGDLYEGYAAVLDRVLDRVPFSEQRPRPGRVSVAGFFFHRHEPDVAADSVELGRLLSSLGLEPGPCLLGGEPYARLMEAAESEALVCLPYLDAGGRPPRSLPCRKVRAGLPMGINGTAAWLRRVGAELGVKPSRVSAAVGRGRAGPAFAALTAKTRRSLKGRRSAVFADTPLAAGLAGFAAEVGLPPVLVGLRDESLGGKEAFLRLLRQSGTEPPKDLEVLCNPPLADARRSIAALCRDGSLGLLFGSNYEAAEPGRAGLRIPVVETGFPCVGWHASEPSPSLGFAGAECLAERILAGLASCG